jgi:hypothetical protein
METRASAATLRMSIFADAFPDSFDRTAGDVWAVPRLAFGTGWEVFLAFAVARSAVTFLDVIGNRIRGLLRSRLLCLQLDTTTPAY